MENYLKEMTAEEEAQLAAAFGQLATDYNPEPPAPITPTIQTQTGDLLTDPEEDEGDEEEEDDDPTTTTTDEDDDDAEENPSVTVGSRTLTHADLQKLLDLQDLLDGPTEESLRRAREVAQPVAPVSPAAPPAPQALTPPEGLDLEDPSVKALWELTTALHANQQTLNNQYLHRQQQEAVEQVERAVTDWQTKYHLDDTNLATVRSKAGATNVAAALVNSGKTVYEATNAALEQAFWSDDSLRTQYLNAAQSDNAKRERQAESKRRKAGQLAGRGSTSSSPKPVAEMTREERREAMTREIAEHLARS